MAALPWPGRRWSVPSLALPAALVAMGVYGCECVSEAAAPPPTPECAFDIDCGIGEACRDGLCVDALPIGGEGEGEGEPGEGEGEPGEGEGEGEGQSDLVVAPPSISLPETTIGVAVTGTAQLVNIGDAALTIGTITSSNGAFTIVEPAAGTALPPGNSRTLTVRFTPTVAGAASAIITVPAGASTGTLQVSGNVAAVVVDGAFVARAGPDDQGVGLADCQCSTAVSPANVDLVYEVSGGAGRCARPGNIACGVNDSCAPCNLGPQGQARWRSGRTEQARQGETMIVDEEIIHAGTGDDGDFTVTATLVDDCTTLMGSLNQNTNHTCCAFIDCGTGAPLACYPYQDPISCVTDCQAFVAFARNDDDCMARGPVLVRARLTIDGSERQFCGTMNRDQSVELARVSRRSGAFTITSVGAFAEVAPGAPCP